MKDFINKPANFNRIEFWAATTLFVFLVFFHISDAVHNGETRAQVSSAEANVPFSYYFVAKLIQYAVLYLAFLFLNFIVVPKLIRKEGLFQNILSVILTLLAAGTVFGVKDTYLKYNLAPADKPDWTVHNFLFRSGFLYASWLLLVFGFYTAIKYTGLYLLSRTEAIQSKYKFITPGALVAFVLWMVSMFLLLISNADSALKTGWAIVIPCGILLYCYSFHTLIPKSLSKKRPFTSYIAKTLLVLIISLLPVGLLGLLLTNDEDPAMAIAFFNAAFQLLITAPLTWILFKRRLKGNEEIYTLKKELGQTHASFDFLRSQINPHFLFNALNTIYGTAIQEKAERTGEGIEKLGDMMRFMLQENMQEKISLAREIDYLNNYIGLQKLRTDPNPNIRIEAEIEQPLNPVQIAPMLLIPFVENAFKHGISFREPSHIKITLEVKNDTLYFDVHNSKYAKPKNDPEKYKSGIGLNNVKQRLQLLYPGKHELIIRETGKEFFIHLTLQLS